MARQREYWVQLETLRWNARPWGIDRLGGEAGSPASTGDLLVLRTYTANWQQPADQPLNPWDLTERPDGQTPGALPCTVLEAKVADEIVVHFRNQDQRPGLPVVARTHSLHPGGVQRAGSQSGSFPLALPDLGQAGKQGDRVPPGGDFTYRWTCPHRSTAGFWPIRDGAQTALQHDAWDVLGTLVVFAAGEQAADPPDRPLRAPGDGPLRFASVPEPPRRADYRLVFHELPEVGLCLNGRQGFGNTPVLVAGSGTRMTVRCLNATRLPLSFALHGHRWEQGDRWVDGELLAPGGGVTLSLLSDSSEHGGGPGEWMIVGRAGSDTAIGSLLVTGGGSLTLSAA